MKVSFHSFIYSLKDNIGHFFNYQLSLRHSMHALGARYKGYLNKNCAISNHPDDWEKSLLWVIIDSKFMKLVNLYGGFLSFARFFLRKAPKKERRILFVESPNAIDIFSLALSSLFFSRGSDEIWLMIHFDYRGQPFSWVTFKVCIRLLHWRLRKRVQLFTLSDRTKFFYEERTGLPVHLIPYPYTVFTSGFSENSKKDFVWWPGGPRIEKGLNTILSISDQFIGKTLKLALSEEASPLFKKNPQLVFVNAELTRDEYISMLLECRGVLLPYDRHKYRLRSSGIFIESIIAGKPVFVRRGTWSASELKKYDLEELILDWEHSDIVKHIEELLDDQQVHVKLAKMQRAYREYHSLETHTHLLGEILTSQP